VSRLLTALAVTAVVVAACWRAGPYWKWTLIGVVVGMVGAVCLTMEWRR